MDSHFKNLWKLFFHRKKTKTFFGWSIIPNIITEKWGYSQESYLYKWHYIDKKKVTKAQDTRSEKKWSKYNTVLNLSVQYSRFIYSLKSFRNSRIVFTCIKSQNETQIKMQSKKGISSISLDMKYDDSFCAAWPPCADIPSSSRFLFHKVQ